MTHDTWPPGFVDPVGVESDDTISTRTGGAMSAETGQYIDRLGALAYETGPHKHEVEDSYGEIIRYKTIGWDDLNSYVEHLISGIGYNPGVPERSDWMDAAEAVATTVLRDLMETIDAWTFLYEGTECVDPEQSIRDFARDRGIDLGGEG